MPRRNEQTSMVRQEPFEYRADFDGGDDVIYEGWTAINSATTDESWIICKHTYTDGNLTRTQWVGTDFNQKWSLRATLF